MYNIHSIAGRKPHYEVLRSYSKSEGQFVREFLDTYGPIKKLVLKADVGSWYDGEDYKKYNKELNDFFDTNSHNSKLIYVNDHKIPFYASWLNKSGNATLLDMLNFMKTFSEEDYLKLLEVEKIKRVNNFVNECRSLLC